MDQTKKFEIRLFSKVFPLTRISLYLSIYLSIYLYIYPSIYIYILGYVGYIRRTYLTSVIFFSSVIIHDVRSYERGDEIGILEIITAGGLPVTHPIGNQ